MGLCDLADDREPQARPRQRRLTSHLDDIVNDTGPRGPGIRGHHGDGMGPGMGMTPGGMGMGSGGMGAFFAPTAAQPA